MYDRKDEGREKFLNMHAFTQQKEKKISDLETRIEQLKQDYEPYKAQDDNINLLFTVFPHLSERLRIAQVMQGYRIDNRHIKQLFKGEPFSFTGKLNSPEHNHSFNVQDAKLQLFRRARTPTG